MADPIAVDRGRGAFMARFSNAALIRRTRVRPSRCGTLVHKEIGQQSTGDPRQPCDAGIFF